MRAGGHPSPTPCCLCDSSTSSTSFPIKTSPYNPLPACLVFETWGCVAASFGGPGPQLVPGVGISGLAGRWGLLPCHGSGDPSPWAPPALAPCHRLSRGTRGCSDPRVAVSGGSGPSPSGPVSLLEEWEPRALSWPREHREGRHELRRNQHYQHSARGPEAEHSGRSSCPHWSVVFLRG